MNTPALDLFVKKIDTGGYSFARIREEDCYYVDKTLLIKDIFDEDIGGIYLFTRPRRFGKTLNLSMIDAYFNINYRGNTWFDGLAISEHPELDGYKNSFPVIHMDLRNAKTGSNQTYEDFIEKIGVILYGIFDRFRYLLESDKTDDDKKALFEKILRMDISPDQMQMCIPMLCSMLRMYHGKKVIVLIDEYDRAVSDSFGSESHRPILDFLGGFLEPILKNNPDVQMAYVTGVMQIAKESIFSGINNITVNNTFSVRSDERFGFTETEVKNILTYYGHPEKFEEIEEWYDGYRFGNKDVYNPFSIMNYVSNGFLPDAYWANSGGDSVVRWLLEKTTDENFRMIRDLVMGRSICMDLSDSLIYEDVRSSNKSIFSLMTMSGYLKAVRTDDGFYDVSIPNREVRGVVKTAVENMVPVDSEVFDKFNIAVLKGDVKDMERSLRHILLGASYLNLTSGYSYQLVLMTMMYSLSRRYDIRTETEEGNGGVDMIMIPKAEGTTPIILELKKVDSENHLDKGLDEAMGQIHEKKYYAGMKGETILIAIAFWEKFPRIRTETVDPATED